MYLILKSYCAHSLYSLDVSCLLLIFSLCSTETHRFHKEMMRHALIWLIFKGTNLLNFSGTFFAQAMDQDFAEEFS